MYSNDTYTVMNTQSAEHSMYNEHNDGFSTEFTNRALARNVFSASFFLKDDVHTEHGIYPGISPFPLIEPALRDSDIQTSIGLQDVIRITSRLYRHRRLQRGSFRWHTGPSVQFRHDGACCRSLASPRRTNTSFSGCTAHVWNYNPQAAVSYEVTKSGNLLHDFCRSRTLPDAERHLFRRPGRGAAESQSSAGAQP